MQEIPSKKRRAKKEWEGIRKMLYNIVLARGIKIVVS